MRFSMLPQPWFKSITWLVHGYKGERRKYLFKMASRQGKGEESMLNLVELVHRNVITDLCHTKKYIWEFDVWELVSKAINSGVQIVIIAINGWRPKSSCCSVRSITLWTVHMKAWIPKYEWCLALLKMAKLNLSSKTTNSFKKMKLALTNRWLRWRTSLAELMKKMDVVKQE